MDLQTASLLLKEMDSHPDEDIYRPSEPDLTNKLIMESSSYFLEQIIRKEKHLGLIKIFKCIDNIFTSILNGKSIIDNTCITKHSPIQIKLARNFLLESIQNLEIDLEVQSLKMGKSFTSQNPPNQKPAMDLVCMHIISLLNILSFSELLEKIVYLIRLSHIPLHNNIKSDLTLAVIALTQPNTFNHIREYIESVINLSSIRHYQLWHRVFDMPHSRL